MSTSNSVCSSERSIVKHQADQPYASRSSRLVVRRIRNTVADTKGDRLEPLKWKREP